MVVQLSLREVMQFYNVYGDKRGGKQVRRQQWIVASSNTMEVGKTQRSWRLKLVEVKILVQQCFCGEEI